MKALFLIISICLSASTGVLADKKQAYDDLISHYESHPEETKITLDDLGELSFSFPSLAPGKTWEMKLEESELTKGKRKLSFSEKPKNLWFVMSDKLPQDLVLYFDVWINSTKNPQQKKLSENSYVILRNNNRLISSQQFNGHAFTLIEARRYRTIQVFNPSSESVLPSGKLVIKLRGLVKDKWEHAKRLHFTEVSDSRGQPLALSWEDALKNCQENGKELPQEKDWLGAFLSAPEKGEKNGARWEGKLTTSDNWQKWYDAGKYNHISPVNEGFNQGPFYHLLGNFAEWVQANGVVVAICTDDFFEIGLEPNVDILQVNSVKLKSADHFWNQVKKAKGENVTLLIQAGSEEKTLSVLKSILTPSRLLVTERLLKGGSWYDSQEKLTPQARTLVITSKYYERFNYASSYLKKSQKLLKKLKKEGFSIAWRENDKILAGFRYARK